MGVTATQDAKKLAKIEEFREWLIKEDIRFIEKANGHFQIFNHKGKLCYQVWATTEKMNIQTTNDKCMGMSRIEDYIAANLDEGEE